MLVPGSPQYQQFIKDTEEFAKKCKEIPWLPETTGEALGLVFKSVPRCLYQLQQEFEVENPGVGYNLSKLVEWQIKKGYFPKQLLPHGANPHTKVLEAVWGLLLGVGCMEKLSEQIGNRIKSSDLDLKEIFLESRSVLERKGRSLNESLKDWLESE